MRLGAVALILFLFFSLSAATLFVERSSANFMPEQAPAGIVIKGDGSVEGTDLIRYESGVYTLTGDIGRTIVVLRDGIVIDGAGHSLHGGGSGVGLFLQGRRDVEVRNITVSNFEFGIKFTWLSYGSPDVTARNIVSDNVITNNTYGIVFSDSSSCIVLKSNQFLDNEYCLWDNAQNANDVDSSNSADGKPIYYWVEQHGRTVPSDAGFVVLKNCANITVQNLELQGNVQGVLLYRTIDSTITGNFLANNMDGIVLKESTNNQISGNHVANNKRHGVYLDANSGENIVSDNKVESNGADGIFIGYYSFDTAPGNTITGNEITGNQGNGVTIFNGHDSEVSGNNITLNQGCGIRLGYGTTNIKVNGNFIAKNGLGIQVESPVEYLTGGDTRIINGTPVSAPASVVVPKGSTITGNMVTENNGWGIRLNNSQGGNVIHHNSFVNNHVAEGLQVSIPAIWIFNLPSSVKDGPTLAPGKPNAWDDGMAGNYWSKYTSRYPNASEVGNTGVGNTPFFINENNIDRFPLMKPVTISGILLAPGGEPNDEPAILVLDNSTLPNQQDYDSVETGLPLDHTFLVASAFMVAGVAIASTVLLLRKKKLKTKT